MLLSQSSHLNQMVHVINSTDLFSFSSMTLISSAEAQVISLNWEAPKVNSMSLVTFLPNMSIRAMLDEGDDKEGDLN